MLTFTSDNGKFRATLIAEATDDPNYAGAMFSRSRSTLRLERLDSQVFSAFRINSTGGTAGYYYTSPAGVLELSLKSDVATAIAQGNPGFGLDVKLYNDNDLSTAIDTMTGVFSVFVGIGYADTDAPKSKDVTEWSAALGPGVVLPPNVMLNPSDGQGIIAESNFGTSGTLDDRVWSEVANGISATVTPTGARGNQLEVSAAADTLVLSQSVGFPPPSHSWKLDKPHACADLVLCRWTSLTGAVRQHYFPVVTYIGGNDKSVSLVTTGDGYDVRRNAFKAVRCRLTGLTPYGVWYYADILQANDLHAIVNHTTSDFATEIASVQTCAFADADGYETPEGVGFFNFEFSLKLRHYDTI
jgi:hypothetical protein